MDKSYEIEKIITTPEDRRIVEKFMKYPELDLPMYMTWNDVMPIVHAIESNDFKFQICRRRVEIEKDGEHLPFAWILSKENSKLKSAWVAIIMCIQKLNNE